MHQREYRVEDLRTAGIAAGAVGALCVATAVYVGWAHRRYARYVRDTRYTRHTRHLPYVRH